MVNRIPIDKHKTESMFWPKICCARSKAYSLWLLAGLVGLYAQAQDQIIRVTEAFKPNVVAIQSSFADGSIENGFGFITGEKNGQLYLVTAGHVVHGREVKTPQKIQVRFYSSLRQYPAEEENWFEADDLSLLTLPKPSTVQWKPNFAHYGPQNYQTVRFVGKNQDWISPGTGEIFRLSKDRIEFTMYSLEPGCSGAPLIGEKGIMGLILQDDRSSSVALHLNRIRELIGDVRYPYYMGELYDAAGAPPRSRTRRKSQIYNRCCWSKAVHL
jgi:formylglycine-generating enzyme